jgi:hypothetical protein
LIIDDITGFPPIWREKQLKNTLTSEPIAFPTDVIIKIAVVTG